MVAERGEHGIDFDEPCVARVYDYLLGGSHNFAVDRAAAERFSARVPDLAAGVRANRSFLRRAVRYLTGLGVRQFLDLGSGLPTAGNVHEAAPGARVVYVDHEPVAAAHGRTMLADVPRARMLAADLRDVDGVLGSPEVRDLLDLSEPVGLVMVGVFHNIGPDEDAPGLVRKYREALAPGSHLVVSAATRDSGDGFDWAERQTLLVDFHTFRRAEVAELFDGFELVDPGIVHLTRWRPDMAQPSDELVAKLPTVAGVGRL
ncbi:SAM-dependent methyltransferase [Actinocatenispora rupis]|uniref:S-adenosyl methyltransferase n=1 Tax=Actinocatenispora rupis TaxID=519421 RepID=A0A8J3NFJ1_9ACTN|nr:SAM-dependent methyltransferase [Actinocatenispora rupis]GID13859.1 hypothetical protein Aru02nite_47480 [Actinocatenispora rupis]